MTRKEVEALRAKWKQRVDPPPCDHLSLKLELNNLGHSTGHIACFTCGESVARGPSSREASLRESTGISRRQLPATGSPAANS